MSAAMSASAAATARATLQSLEQKLEVEVKEFRALREEGLKHASLRTQLVTQVQENELVKKELDLLEPTANVFKLTGPALLKQDLSDAKSNVASRLQLLKTEMEHVEKKLTELEKKQEDKKKRVMEMQALRQRLLNDLEKSK